MSTFTEMSSDEEIEAMVTNKSYVLVYVYDRHTVPRFETDRCTNIREHKSHKHAIKNGKAMTTRKGSYLCGWTLKSVGVFHGYTKDLKMIEDRFYEDGVRLPLSKDPHAWGHE